MSAAANEIVWQSHTHNTAAAAMAMENEFTTNVYASHSHHVSKARRKKSSPCGYVLRNGHTDCVLPRFVPCMRAAGGSFDLSSVSRNLVASNRAAWKNPHSLCMYIVWTAPTLNPMKQQQHNNMFSPSQMISLQKTFPPPPPPPSTLALNSKLNICQTAVERIHRSRSRKAKHH